MKIYEVGGAVRDRLMGLVPKDHDWCVVGATPEDMLAKGFRPVGADFPVFLHPSTKEEYALARTERKSAPGYSGFQCFTSPEVTLEEDLSRRDLTINAMAQDSDGVIVDPYGGAADLKAKVLRHVSDAFGEDPLRILRVARFWARLGPQWHVAPDTWSLLRSMVEQGAVDELVQERVWKETVRALQEPHPALYLQCLGDLGVWSRLPPGLNKPASAMEPLKRAVQGSAPVTVLFALAFPDSNPLQAKASSEFASLMESLMKLMSAEDAYVTATADYRLDTLLQAGVLRKADVFDQAVSALGYSRPQRQHDLIEMLHRDASRVRAVPRKSIAASMAPGLAVGEAIREAQRVAIV